MFKLIGTHIDGEDWGYDPEFDTREQAELQKQIEVKAYTYNGVCNWEFQVVEI